MDGTDTEKPVQTSQNIVDKREVEEESERLWERRQHMVGVNKFIVTMRLLMDVNAFGDYELQTSGHEHEQTKSIFETINMILWKQQPIHSNKHELNAFYEQPDETDNFHFCQLFRTFHLYIPLCSSPSLFAIGGSIFSMQNSLHMTTYSFHVNV